MIVYANKINGNKIKFNETDIESIELNKTMLDSLDSFMLVTLKSGTQHEFSLSNWEERELKNE